MFLAVNVLLGGCHAHAYLMPQHELQTGSFNHTNRGDSFTQTGARKEGDEGEKRGNRKEGLGKTRGGEERTKEKEGKEDDE